MIFLAFLAYVALTIATVALALVTLLSHAASGLGTPPNSLSDYLPIWGILGFFWILVIWLHNSWIKGGQE